MNGKINVVKAEPVEDASSAPDGTAIDVETGGGDGIHPLTMNGKINVVKAEPVEDASSAPDGTDIDVETGGGDGNAVTTTIKPKDHIKPGYYRIRWLIVPIRG